jgi:hypothetical protein
MKRKVCIKWKKKWWIKWEKSDERNRRENYEWNKKKKENKYERINDKKKELGMEVVNKIEGWNGKRSGELNGMGVLNKVEIKIINKVEGEVKRCMK